MSNLSIDNFVSVTVAIPPTGVSDAQVNNLALFTKESPINTDLTASNPGIYLSATDVAADWGSSSEAYRQAVQVFSQTPNILSGGGSLVIYPMQLADSLATAVTAALTAVPFFGVLVAGYDPTDDEYIAAAAVCEPARKKLFVSSYLAAALDDGTGLFALLKATSYPHTRMFLYLVGGTTVSARLAVAAYAGRAMSCDFNGVATLGTMNAKDLVGVTADSLLTQTYLNRCEILGVDTYGAYSTVPCVKSEGANQFWDLVYATDWLVLALQTAAFNALRQTGTKIPQTEAGMATLRSYIIAVLQQAVNNGFVAPGAWDSPDTFGNKETFLQAIAQQGWYIYNLPVSQQLPAARQARQAPVIRIAVKTAGAIHSVNIIGDVNP